MHSYRQATLVRSIIIYSPSRNHKSKRIATQSLSRFHGILRLLRFFWNFGFEYLYPRGPCLQGFTPFELKQRKLFVILDRRVTLENLKKIEGPPRTSKSGFVCNKPRWVPVLVPLSLSSFPSVWNFLKDIKHQIFLKLKAISKSSIL